MEIVTWFQMEEEGGSSRAKQWTANVGRVSKSGLGLGNKPKADINSFSGISHSFHSGVGATTGSGVQTKWSTIPSSASSLGSFARAATPTGRTQMVQAKRFEGDRCETEV